jgi:hypothetical protein
MLDYIKHYFTLMEETTTEEGTGKYLIYFYSIGWLEFIYIYIYLISWSGVRLSSLGTSATIWPSVPATENR